MYDAFYLFLPKEYKWRIWLNRETNQANNNPAETAHCVAETQQKRSLSHKH